MHISNDDQTPGSDDEKSQDQRDSTDSPQPTADAGQPFDINENTVDDPEDNDREEDDGFEGRGDPSGSPFNINDRSVDGVED